MRKNVLLVSNVLLYLAGCALAGTGLLLELRLDEGEAAAVAGVGRDEWGEFHFIVALVFLGLILLHVILNWAWIAGMFNRKRLVAIAVTIGVSLTLIGGLLLLPASGSSGEHGRADRHEIDRD